MDQEIDEGIRNMSGPRKLAEAEWRVMNAVWGHNKPVTVREIHQHLYPNGEKAYTTVQTILNILFEKGFLRREKIGMVNFYFPAVAREVFARDETKSLVARMFQGSFGALATFLVDAGDLSAEELAQLRALIEAKEKITTSQQASGGVPCQDLMVWPNNGAIYLHYTRSKSPCLFRWCGHSIIYSALQVWVAIPVIFMLKQRRQFGLKNGF
jgi:predicted transcriptional regulator